MTAAKTAPKAKATPKRPVKSERTAEVAPGHPDFDWRTIFPEGVALKRYVDPSGVVVCLPPFPQPDQGDIFADLIEDVPDQIMLLRLIRQAMREYAADPDVATRSIAQAFRGGGKLESVEALLRFWGAADSPK